MSKMSDLAIELNEQAAELGFESYEEALANGYEVDYENRELEKAHEAWLFERDKTLHWLEKLSKHLESHQTHDIFGGYLDFEIVNMAIKLIKEGER